MAKKARLPINPKPAPQRPAWIGFAVTALVAGVCGAVIAASIHPRAAPKAALIVSPASVVTPPIAAPVDATAQTASSIVPPPELILDLPPAKAALNLGNWSYDHKNWTAAIVYYQEAVKRGFDNPDVLTDMGNAYRFSNQPQQAIAQYELAQRKNPQHENSLFNEGGVYANSLGDAKKAIEIWNQYLQRFPNGGHRVEALQLIDETKAHSGMNAGNAPAAAAQ